MPEGEIVLSVVSHGQGSLVRELFEDLKERVRTPLKVILTENIPENPGIRAQDYPFPVEVIRNDRVKGFGANHNAALARAHGAYFCVVNPDIRLPSDPFPALVDAAKDRRLGVIAPLVTDPSGRLEDHARKFPSIFTLAGKVLGSRPRMVPPAGAKIFHPDWVAGMFMFFRTTILREACGFDERYFLYYEDVDLCARLRSRGLEVAVCTSASVIHNARRVSRRNLRYFWLHLLSAARFLAARPAIAFGRRPADGRG